MSRCRCFSLLDQGRVGRSVSSPVRCRDYRQTWVERPAAFGHRVRAGVEERNKGASGRHGMICWVDDSSNLTKTTLDRLEGHRAPLPVRVGRGASDQLLLDFCGEPPASLRAFDVGLLGTWGSHG